MALFFTNTSNKPWLEDNASWFSCHFSTENFYDGLYNQYNIPLPKTLKNAVTKRKAEYLAGRYCAVNALMAENVLTRHIASGPMRNPVWPTGITGSISHSSNQAVAVVLKDNQISLGVDIEKIVATDQAHSLESQILTPNEITLFNNYPTQYALLFSLAFSAKESFFKASFPIVLKYFNFDAVTIRSIDFSLQQLLCEVTNSPHPRLPFGYKFYVRYCLLPDNMVASYVSLDLTKSEN